MWSSLGFSETLEHHRLTFRQSFWHKLVQQKMSLTFIDIHCRDKYKDKQAQQATVRKAFQNHCPSNIPRESAQRHNAFSMSFYCFSISFLYFLNVFLGQLWAIQYFPVHPTALAWPQWPWHGLVAAATRPPPAARCGTAP